MNTTHQFLITCAVFLAVAGCDDADVLRDGSCDVDIVVAGGVSWAKSCDWPAYAEMADWPGILHAIDMGLLVPDQNEHDCFEMTFADGSVCVLDIDGIDVLARPVDQVGPFKQFGCQAAKPWNVMRSTADGQCWAVGASLAYRVL